MGRKNLENFIKSLDWINSELSKAAYIAGENYSVADITLLCAIDFALFAKVIELSNYPALKTWYQKVSERPSSQA